MVQTKSGAAKMRETIYSRYGEDHYKKIGALGGKKSSGPDYQKGGAKAVGSAAHPDLARVAGSKGGMISKRKPASYYQAYDKEGLPKLDVTKAEQQQLKQLAEALQAEANVISY